MSLADLSSLFVEFVGWAVFHSIWLGVLVTLLSELTFFIGRQWSSHARYLLAMIFMAVFALGPIVTTLVRSDRILDQPPQLYSPDPNVKVAGVRALPEPRPMYATQETPYQGWRVQIAAAFSPLLPYVVGVWMLGGIGFGMIRAWMIFLMHRQIVRANQEIESIRGRISVLRLKLGLRKKVIAVCSDLVSSPATLGFIKPLILIPTSMLSSLAPAELDLILMHELAHIRRHDYLVNLIQVCVEHLYFYHPGMWRLSKRMRIERENCCDDMAVQMSGAPLEYARALTSLETIRMRPPVLSQGLAGTGLKSRVIRILKPHPAELGPGGMAFPSIVILFALILTCLGAVAINNAADQLRNYKMLQASNFGELVYAELGCGKSIDDQQALASLTKAYEYCRLLADKQIEKIPDEQLETFAREWIAFSGPNTIRQKLVDGIRPESFDRVTRQSTSQPWLKHESFKLVSQLWGRAKEVRKTDPSHAKELTQAAVLLSTHRSADCVPMYANSLLSDPAAFDVLQVNQTQRLRLLRIVFFFTEESQKQLNEMTFVNKLVESLDDSGAALSDDEARQIASHVGNLLTAGENRESTRWLGAMAVRHLRIRFAESQPAQWKIIAGLLDDPSMSPTTKSWCQPLSPEAQAAEDRHGFVHILKRSRYWVK